MSNLVRRLRDPEFGTETSERNLMTQAADRIAQLEEVNEMMLTDIRRTDVDMLAFKARIAQLEAALEDIAYPNPLHNEDDLMRTARAALEERT